MIDIKQQQVKEGGNATFSVKVSKETYELVNILCEGLAHGTNGNDLVKMFIHAFIESAKHDGPISPDMQHFLNLLKIEPGWHKAFNFADVTALTEIAQIIIVLQQQGRKGFGLTMIDKPWMGEPTQTMCVDEIFERVVNVSMPYLSKRIISIGDKFCCSSIRETLTLLCEYMDDYLQREEDQAELPGYGEYHDFGKAMESIRLYKRVQHRTPDSVSNSQAKIDFKNNLNNEEENV